MLEMLSASTRPKGKRVSNEEIRDMLKLFARQLEIAAELRQLKRKTNEW